MDLPRAKGRLVAIGGRTVLVAACPLCGGEHRWDKGPARGPGAEEVRARGYSDEWLPCRADLPGNFCRVLVGGGTRRPARGRGRPPSGGGDGAGGRQTGGDAPSGSPTRCSMTPRSAQASPCAG